jgi:hypothetical protein
MRLEKADIVLSHENNLFSMGIDIVTDSPWTHVLLVADPVKKVGIHAKALEKVQYCFINDYKVGCLILRVPNLTDGQREKVLKFATDQLGKKYDYLAILHEFSRYKLGVQTESADHERFICSTLVSEAFRQAGILITDQQLPSPDDLYKSKQIVVVGRLGVDI